MDLTFFFSGKMSREEVTSAFLATLLRHHEGFRCWFLRLLHLDHLSGIAQDQWEVKIEKDGIDVWMAVEGGPVVIIENKLFQGAVQAHQLQHYFEKEVGLNCDRPVVAVYLAPGNSVGNLEVERVSDSKMFRQGCDRALRLSWDEVLRFVPATDDANFVLIASGLTSVRAEIESGLKDKYPLEGTRTAIHELMKMARECLAVEVPSVSLRPWRGRAFQRLFTKGEKITVCLTLRFATEQTEPYAPIDVLQPDGSLSVTLWTEIKLSTLGRKDHALRSRWKTLLRDQKIEVPGVGRHDLAGTWFRHSEQLHGSVVTLASRVAEAGKAVFNQVSQYQ